MEIRRRSRRVPEWAGASVGSAILVAAAPAAAVQSEPAQAEQPRLTLEDLPPPVRLGARVSLVKQRLGLAGVVMIVPDGASFGAAISQWTAAGRNPVLIDDGTPAAREDIARFVRAFAPSRVVRWEAPPHQRAEWTGDEASRRDAFESAVRRAWRMPGEVEGEAEADALAHWRKIGFIPPGVVAALMSDPAWTGALALAAGHGQLVAWVDALPEGDVSGEMSLAAADALSETITARCETAGLSWRGIGDDLDAATICLNCPARVRTGDDRKILALTDVIGRAAGSLQRRERWAWAGQVFGTEAQAAYRAMCSLFLQPRRAWLFDGYSDEPPWNLWDMVAAKAELELAQFEVMIDDGARRGRRDWVLRSAGKADEQAGAAGMGVDAGLVCVNSHGHAFEFNLNPGRMSAEGAPFLRRPAALHFVHSFSAMRQGDRNTVAGRWMERGAFAYCGSVDEPHLQAFVPSPLFARRMISAVPFGAAARLDEPHPYAHVWKVHVIGDPLFTLHDEPARREWLDAPAEAEDLDDAMKSALKEGRFADAVRDLVLRGRDADAVRIARSMAAEKGGSRLTAAVAEPALMAAFRTGELDLFVTLGNTLADAGRLDASGMDAAWHALRPALGTLRDQELRLLKRSIRPESAADDAVDLAVSIRGSRGSEAARAFLSEARDLVGDDTGKRRIDEEMAK